MRTRIQTDFQTFLDCNTDVSNHNNGRQQLKVKDVLLLGWTKVLFVFLVLTSLIENYLWVIASKLFYEPSIDIG